MITKDNVFYCDICDSYISKDQMTFAEFYHDVKLHLNACQENKLLTLAYWEKYPISKGELARKYYKDITFDYALPENWVDDMKTKLNVEYHYITCQFVWGYPQGNFFGCPLPLTENAVYLIHKYNRLANTNYPVEF